MNGYASPGGNLYDDYGDSRLPPADHPSGRAAVGAFKKDMLTGLDKDAPRFGQVSLKSHRLQRVVNFNHGRVC